ALNWRYAVRQFSSERIDEEKIQQLLTATRLSATSYGLQPYRLILVNDIDVRKKLLKYAMGQDKVVNCSHLVVFAAQTNIGDDMVDRYIRSVAETRGISVDEFQGLADHMKQVFVGMNAQQKREWAHQQAYIALGTLLTAAAVMEIDTCPMGGIEADGFDCVLGLNELGLETSVICALGVRHPDDSNARLPKVRYGHSEMVIVI
ncbi:MAG TPA: NAD(P)H-dependent oxidoreductase, partial [Gammaproteobacteria bacterium]